MRKLCLSGFCVVAPPPFAVYDSLIANLAVFQQRVSAMPKAPQRLRGKYIEFDETSHCPPFKKLLKRDDQLSSKNMSTLSWTTSQRLENVFYRNIRQWARSGHLVTVKANHHRLPNLLLRPQRQEVTYTMTIHFLHLLLLALAKQVHQWQRQRQR